MNESVMATISLIVGALGLIIAAVACILLTREKAQLKADLEKLRGELTRRALLQEDTTKSTATELKQLLTDQQQLASSVQRDRLAQAEKYLIDKFDKQMSERLLMVETTLGQSIVNVEKEQSIYTAKVNDISKLLEILANNLERKVADINKELAELKEKDETLTKIQADNALQLMDLPTIREQVRQLENNEADTTIRFSTVPAKLELLEQARQTQIAAASKLENMLVELTVIQGQLEEQTQTIADMTNRSNTAIRSAVLDKFLTLMDSEEERKTAAIKFITEIAEEKAFVELCLEFPSEASIKALQNLASKSDNKDISVVPLLKLAEQKLESGLIDEARTLLLQLTEIKDLSGETMLGVFAKLAKICKEQKDSEYADVILNRLRTKQKDFNPEQKLIATEIVNQLTSLFEEVSNKGKLESVYKRLHESFVSSGQTDQVETARNLKKLADLYFEEERYEEAEPSYLRAFATLSKATDPTDVELKPIVKNLAYICSMQNRPEEAEKHNLQLLSILLARKDDDGLLPLVDLLSKSAEDYAAHDDYEHAENLMNRCVTALQKIRGPEDQKTKDASALLDKICHHTEDKAELKKIYRRQMDASRHEPSKRAYHAKIGVKLATLYAAEGEYSQADSLFHSIEHLLPRDKEIARLLDELAKVYSSLAKYDLAESTFNRALEMRESFPGEDRSELMASYANLGASYSVQKDYQMAEMMYKRELESAEEYFGGDNENVITPLMHLAGTYIISGRFAEAEPCYKRILETRYKTQGEGHADLIGSMLHLAELYRIQKNFTEAEIFYESACELAEQVHGPASLKVAEILDKRAALAKASEQSELAEELLERAKKVRTEAESSSAVLFSPGADTAAR